LACINVTNNFLLNDNDYLHETTVSVSIVVLILIVILVWSEFGYYTATELVYKYEVDSDHSR